MLEFLLALAVFLAAHSIPARPALRRRFVSALGERAYLILYSLLSLALLGWLISAAIRAPIVPLWPTTVASYHLALALMLPASWLLAGGLFTPNPLSISLSRRQYHADRPGIVGLVRHPVLWGFILWAAVHTIANGDVVGVILFGGFLLFSLLGMKLVDRRRRRQLGAEWSALSPATRRWTLAQMLITFGGGTLLYMAALHAHPVLFGPDPGAVLFG